jgi:hypothetical protein
MAPYNDHSFVYIRQAVHIAYSISYQISSWLPEDAFKSKVGWMMCSVMAVMAATKKKADDGKKLVRETSEVSSNPYSPAEEHGRETRIHLALGVPQNQTNKSPFSHQPKSTFLL